jgi:2'-hydroxyisoflavone reductase
LKVLVIGGTRFLGRHVVSSLKKQGYDVTIFHRGRICGLFSGVEEFTGDRDRGFKGLEHQKFDAVIDTCSYLPSQVESAIAFFKQNIKHYILISSISAYRDFLSEGIEETYPLGTLPEIESITEVTGETYGPLKAACENVLRSQFAGKSLVVRPGLIVGPWDPTGRFTWWPARINKGGIIPVPGKETDPLQFIDVRDLADWIALAVSNSLSGDFNLVGPEFRLNLSDFISICEQVSSCKNQYRWISEKQLEKEGALFSFSLWCPSSLKEYEFMNSVSNRKAMESGLKFREISETVKATLDWWNQQNETEFPLAGPDLETESRLISL